MIFKFPEVFYLKVKLLKLETFISLGGEPHIIAHSYMYRRVMHVRIHA